MGRGALLTCRRASGGARKNAHAHQRPRCGDRLLCAVLSRQLRFQDRGGGLYLRCCNEGKERLLLHLAEENTAWILGQGCGPDLNVGLGVGLGLFRAVALTSTWVQGFA